MMQQKQNKKFNLRIGILIIFLIINLIITIIFLYINLPFFYEKDAPKSFRFMSDELSYSNELRYDICEFDAIVEATSKTNDFYFGCSFEQLINQQSQCQECIKMIYGDCNSTIQFSDPNYFNELPDYYIEFPFKINKVGRSCKSLIFYNGTQTKADVVETPVLKYDNAILVEWAEKPGIKDFRVSSDKLFIKIGYDTYSINYFVSDYVGGQPYFILNNPNKFIIKFEVSKRYDLVNQDKILFSENVHSDKERQDFWVVQQDIIKSPHLHVILRDSEKHLFKNIINFLFLTLITLWVGYFFIKLIEKKNDTTNTN